MTLSLSEPLGGNTRMNLILSSRTWILFWLNELFTENTILLLFLGGEIEDKEKKKRF